MLHTIFFSGLYYIKIYCWGSWRGTRGGNWRDIWRRSWRGSWGGTGGGTEWGAGGRAGGVTGGGARGRWRNWRGSWRKSLRGMKEVELGGMLEEGDGGGSWKRR